MSPKNTLGPIERVVAAVQLDSVRLADACCWARIRSAGEVERAQVSFNQQAKVAQRSDNGFYVLATGEATVSPGEEASPVVSIKASFELFYRLPHDFEATEQELSGFAEVNGVFNAWPYWREFIQTTTCRMNLPPIVLPVFRLQKAAKKKEVRAKAESSTTH